MAVDAAMVPAYAMEHVQPILRSRGWSADSPDSLLAAICEAFRVTPLNPSLIEIDTSLLASYHDLRVLQQRRVLPFYWCAKQKILHALTAFPWDVSARDALKASKLEPADVVLYMADAGFIAQAIKGHMIAEGLEQAYEQADGPSKVELVKTNVDEQGIWGEWSRLLMTCIRDRANDLHLQPDGDRWVARAEINGKMRTLKQFPFAVGQAMLMVLISRSGIHQQHMTTAQDGVMNVELDDHTRLDVRVAAVPAYSTTGGTVNHLTLRFQEHERLQTLSLDKIFSGDDLRDILGAIQSPGSVSIIAGPTGSGKTVTLGACLRYLNTETRNIYTVEDPVETVIPMITSLPISRQLSYEQALVSLLRKKPHVIMVGEIRDERTANLVVSAALTGHVVLTTLHTDSCSAIPERLCLTLQLHPDQVSSKLRLCSSQRLIGVLCDQCKERDVILTEEECGIFNLPPRYVRMKVCKRNPDGCPNCDRGVKGRKAIIEILRLTTAMRRLITHAQWDDFRSEAIRQMGNRLLQVQALNMLRAGVTDLEAVTDVMSFGDELDVVDVK